MAKLNSEKCIKCGYSKKNLVGSVLRMPSFSTQIANAEMKPICRSLISASSYAWSAPDAILEEKISSRPSVYFECHFF